VTGFENLTQIMGLEQNGAIAAKKGFDSNQLSEMTKGTDIVQIGTIGQESITIDVDLLPKADLYTRYEIWIYSAILKNDPQEHKLLVVYQQTNDIFTMSVFRRTVIIAAALTLVIAGIIGFFMVTKILRPIKTITRTAKEIGEKNLKQRLKTESNDELGELSSTLNHMFERLEAAFTFERQITAEVSHYLRTPLAIAQGEATLSLREERSPEEYRRTIEKISREISNLSSTINRLLFLASSENNKDLILSEANIKNLLTELVSDIDTHEQARGSLRFKLRLT
jgi:signal transduction histidine kinase